MRNGRSHLRPPGRRRTAVCFQGDLPELPTGVMLLDHWSMAPSLFVESRLHDTGGPVPAEAFDAVMRYAPTTISQWSGGKYQVATIDSGPSAAARFGIDAFGNTFKVGRLIVSF